jgi:predicted phage-related endonuclease
MIDRTKRIGGSDVGPILGLSPWRTPLQVWLEKTGQSDPTPPDAQREKLFRRGRLMEPVVIDMLSEEYGVKITKRSPRSAPNYYTDSEHAFLVAEIDFEWEVTPEVRAVFPDKIPEALLGTIQSGEVKTTSPWGAAVYGDEGTDEIPIYYAAQAMAGLMVSGRQLTLFPVLVGSDNLLIYWVWRDEETIAGMRQRLVHFWLENVLKKIPPPPIDLPDIYRMFKRRAATKVPATPQVEAMIQSLRVLTDRKNTTEEGINALQFELGSFLLGAEAMDKPEKEDKGRHIITIGNEPALTVRFNEQNRVDADVLKAQFPDVAAKCMKKAQFYSFNLKRGKS